jgi:hypothetical protein
MRTSEIRLICKMCHNFQSGKKTPGWKTLNFVQFIWLSTNTFGQFFTLKTVPISKKLNLFLGSQSKVDGMTRLQTHTTCQEFALWSQLCLAVCTEIFMDSVFDQRYGSFTNWKWNPFKLFQLNDKHQEQYSDFWI